MNMLREKPFGKLLSLIVAIAFTALMSFNVFAAEAGTVELKQSGKHAEIILTFPQAAKEEIASLQISLSAVLGSEEAAPEFVPDTSLSSKIAEGRFNKDTGTLNIYIAGTSPLFDKENPVLSLGYVRITGDNCYADIKVIKDSLKFVRGTELVVQDIGVEYPDNAVRITSATEGEATTPGGPSYGGGSGDFSVPETTTAATEPVQTPSPSQTSPVSGSETTLPVTTPTETITGAGDTKVTVSSEENVPAIPVEGESFSRADTKALTEAVSRAELYKNSNYSESSDRSLGDAVEKAKALLMDDEAEQERIDEALLIIENAIGMLVPVNAPVSADDNTDDITQTQVNDATETAAETSDSQETEQSSDDTSTPLQSDESDTQQPSDIQSEDDTSSTADGSEASDNSQNSDGNLLPWIIVLIILAVAVVAIAIAAIIGSNRKKSKKSVHLRNDRENKK